ncbi:PH and SEC7 domain-containing protein C11E3.11c [Choanephora cucurbitarum]|uniref:PH and SEC7 domain-containing protein C11E3.11c n=1 Tax=Choanephora cucurbitarum TaxID=101091 RepID=A0A1C7NHU2_9FUNG|nr:PH and SEC7 domain-containing protein C11E3.11c [Choanephora cucurbitarum]
MLPNSRIIPPNTEQTNARRRSNSVLNDKKGLISRLLTKEQPSLQNQQRSIHDYISDSQREDHTYHSSFEHSKPISSSTKTNSTGFGKLFKKRGKVLDDDLVLNTEEDQPHIRPIQHQQSKSHNKIPLAPPPEYPKAKTISQPDQHQFLTNLPVHYLTKRPTHDPPPIQLPPIPTPTIPSSPIDIGSTPLEADSTSSLRKSSGSYSIYSTFGGDESIYSADSLEQPRYSAQSVGGESVNSFTTVVSQQHSSEEIDDTDSATTTIITATSSDDEDDFVDATGFSQEDIEREQRMLEEEEVNNGSLTKRLSGGHYGSAGGLVASIQKNENRLSKSPPGSPVPALPIPPVPPIPEQHQPHHRRKSKRSTTPDDDLAESMLNWKRHSGNSKRWSARSSVQSKTVFSKDEKRASTITVIDLRSTLPSEPEELSTMDKMALRKQAEEALSGTKAVSTSCLPLASKDDHLPSTLSFNSVPRANSLQFTTDFSKTLDDVWKTSEDNLHLFNDPRSKTLETNIKVHVSEQEGPTEELEKAKQAACLLWNEDETIVAREKMAEWLGKGKPFQTAVLYEYMQLFVFHEMRLDSAFRKLCSKLYFKAEAQQIDRILECFANRYWECNPDNLFGSADTVYAVVYSLLLLNTDLHVAQGNHARMTRSEFIRNTMSTIREQRDEHNSPEYRNWEAEVEFNLKEMYTSVKHYQILQPLGKDSHLTKRGSILRGRRVIGIKRSVHSIIRKSARESILMTETQDQDTIVVSPTTSSSPSLGPPPRNSMSSSYNRSTTPSSSIKSPRRDSYSSTNSSVASLGSPHSPQPTVQYINTHATSLFSSRPPYFKEGIVVRKHLLETANQKAKHREWKECFVEVGHTGELRMYALQDGGSEGHSNRSLFRHSTTIQDLKHNNKWASSAQLIGKVALNHTLSNPLPPPGYNRQRPHVFALQQSDGGVYLFQVASAEQAQEWVMTCNYWAARESKQNVDTGVGNMEYGWGDCLGDVVMDLDAMHQGYDQTFHLHSALQDPDSIMIQDWIPPTPTMVSSQLDEEKQFESLQQHLVYLNNEINYHRDIKSKVFIKFPVKCHNYNRVLSNWETRSKYLLHDIIKYQNYCDALEKSLQTRQELKREKEEEGKKTVVYDSILPNSKLEYQSSAVDLFKEINQELRFV